MLDELTELFIVGAILDENDILHKGDDHSDTKALKALIKTHRIGDIRDLQSKYVSLGWKFKTLKVAFDKSQGNLFKLALNLPYYLIFNSKLEAGANAFDADPKQHILSLAWNSAGVVLFLARTSQ